MDACSSQRACESLDTARTQYLYFLSASAKSVRYEAAVQFTYSQIIIKHLVGVLGISEEILLSFRKKRMCESQQCNRLEAQAPSRRHRNAMWERRVPVLKTLLHPSHFSSSHLPSHSLIPLPSARRCSSFFAAGMLLARGLDGLAIADVQTRG